jgi:hypothetical protein
MGDETISMTYKLIDDSDDSDSSTIAEFPTFEFKVLVNIHKSIKNTESISLNFEI